MVNILEILRERNGKLVAEIERLKNEEKDSKEELTFFYEGVVADLKEIVKRTIEYQDEEISPLTYNYSKEKWLESVDFDRLDRLESQLEEIINQWDDREGQFGEKWRKFDEAKRQCSQCPSKIGEWKQGVNWDRCSKCGYEVDAELKMIKVFKEAIIRSVNCFLIYKRLNFDESSFSACMCKKLDLAEEKLGLAEEKIKKLSEEKEKLEVLVKNLEKVPNELFTTQLNWYKHQYSQEFAELEKNVTGRHIEMSDFINLLARKRKVLTKKIRLSKKSLNNLQQSNNKFNQQLNQEKYQIKQVSAELRQERTNYHKTAIDLVKEKFQAREATMALKNRALELKNVLVSEQDKVKNLQNKIQQAEQDLGTSLNNLATELEGKTIAEYKQIQERERDEFASQLAHTQLEIRNYKGQLEQQKDYQKIKQERDQLKTELNQKEHQIIIKIIGELKLGLNNETNLEQVLDKIKELIADKTPDTNQEDKLNSLRQQVAAQGGEIKKLREQNKENYEPPETVKERIGELFIALGIENSVYQKKLAQITSLRELESFRQEVIKKETNKIRKQKNETENLNIILWVLFISSLLTIITLIIRMKRSKLLTQKEDRQRNRK